MTWSPVTWFPDVRRDGTCGALFAVQLWVQSQLALASYQIDESVEVLEDALPSPVISDKTAVPPLTLCSCASYSPLCPSGL